MQKLPVIGQLWDFLVSPTFPRTAVSISETDAVLVGLKRSGREFEAQHLAVVRLPAGLIRADFREPNILDEEALARELEKLAVQAGLRRLNNVAVALPEGSVRSLVLSVESASGGRQEMLQMLEWKVERAAGCAIAEARASYRRLKSTGAGSQWLVTVSQRAVIEQYEHVFRRLGWNAGLLLPAHLAEAQLLLNAEGDGDQLLVSLNPRGFVAVISRNGEPILIRDVECSWPEMEDEFHRLMIYYRDRLTAQDLQPGVKRLLVLGTSEDQERLRRAAAESLEAPIAPLDAGMLGFRLPASVQFPTVAAAAGLAIAAWAA
ncbi:MAG: hypothetical protein KF868_03350 [Acidobacteria bacterium]|nr:hypothetical protein [Acidobacteriota bacterium]MCW5967220.1 hypothetical protein [Blastocatellales bacterium]